jgi:thiol-disulfide isomerase/thioredoxin
MNTPSTGQCPKCSALNPQGSRFCNACAEPLGALSGMPAVNSPAIEMGGATATPKLGLAIASLVLGIGACMLSLFVAGALFGLVGLVLGLIHIIQKRGPNGMAWWGFGLSIFGILASIAAGVFFYYQVYAPMKGLSTASLNTFDQWVGAEAPDIAVTTLDGKSIVLSQLRGKRVVLDFWATWCGPCVMEMPHLERLHNEISSEDLVILGISNEDEPTVRAFVAQKGVRYPIASARSLPSPYRDIRSIPTKFFIDRNGIVQSVMVGSLNFDQLKGKALTADFEGTRKSSPGGTAQISNPIDLETPLPSADPWVGIWKFNPEKSKPQSAGMTSIGDSFVTYREMDPETVEITSVEVLRNGSQTISWKCTVPKSGGMQTYQQGAPVGYSIFKTVVDDRTQYLTYLQDGKQIYLATLALSEDGKTYTLSSEPANAMGQSNEEVSVYEKQ